MEVSAHPLPPWREYFGKFYFYYAIGNTPPVDLTPRDLQGVEKARILMLANGEFRSLLCTIWKNSSSPFNYMKSMIILHIITFFSFYFINHSRFTL